MLYIEHYIRKLPEMLEEHYENVDHDGMMPHTGLS